ncbi:37228_t:CDS:2, partial [Gigaspora margarita]
MNSKNYNCKIVMNHSSVARVITVNKTIISKYFVQRLLFHFGKLDKDLVTLKIEYNSNPRRSNNNSLQNIPQNIKTPWASDLDMKQYGIIHFLSACPYALKEAKVIMSKNLEQIKDLIMNQKFIPFPP